MNPTQTSESKTTTDHDKIRAWAEERKGKPAVVKGTEGEDSAHAGLLRIKFEGDEDLKEIDWQTFFDTFEGQNLKFVYYEQTKEGETSRFNKFTSRQE